MINSLKGHLTENFFLGKTISVVDVAVYIELTTLTHLKFFELENKKGIDELYHFDAFKNIMNFRFEKNSSIASWMSRMQD